LGKYLPQPNRKRFSQRPSAMPRKLEPDTPSVQAYRSIAGDQFFAGTMEEFSERDAYDEELLGDEELKRPQVPIRNVARSDFIARLPEQQKKMGIPPPNSMGASFYGKVTLPMAFIRGVKHGSTSPLSELEPGKHAPSSSKHDAQHQIVRLQEMKIRKRHQVCTSRNNLWCSSSFMLGQISFMSYHDPCL
jgi:hypothetical protein